MNRTYLLVDDNPQFLENVAEILQDTGARVETAESGARALELIARTPFDAVVTDMRMPGMNGAELLAKIREVDPDVPVILLSAFSQDALLRDARRNGLLAVLAKPHQTPQLHQLLESARRGGNVVLVEDDVGLADNLTEALSARGLTVCAVADVREVEDVGIRPFAALVDLRVPGGAFGEGLTRVQSRFPGTPTLVITAYSEKAPEHGELFSKPFDTGQLIARIESLYHRVPPSP